MTLTIFSGLWGVKKEESFCYFAAPSSIFPLSQVTLPDYMCNRVSRGDKYLHKIKMRYKVYIINTILYQIKEFQIIISLDICFTQNNLRKKLIIHYYFSRQQQTVSFIWWEPIIFFSEMCMRGMYDSARKKVLLDLFIYLWLCERLSEGL